MYPKSKPDINRMLHPINLFRRINRAREQKSNNGNAEKGAHVNGLNNWIRIVLCAAAYGYPIASCRKRKRSFIVIFVWLEFLIEEVDFVD